MCSKCCGNCIYSWGEQWHNSVDGVKYEYYCAQEKDAFIVQLRGEVTMYRDAYRLAKYQLDQAMKELRELKGDKNNG